jgi:ATP-dependent DNA helicase RecQ
VPANGKTRRDEVLDLYQSGRGVAEIADIFNIKPATVTNHLWEALKDGATVAPEPLLANCTLPAEQQARVLEAFERLGADFLRPVYDALGEMVGWDELHLLRLYFVASAWGSASAARS